MQSGRITTEYLKERYSKYAMYGSLFPFLVLTFLMLILGKNNHAFEPIIEIFKVWSIIVISFLGGIRFGLSIAPRAPEQKSIFYSTIPVMLAWLAILLPNAYSILVLLVIHCALGAWDNFYVSSGNIKPWYGRQRMIMAACVALFHVIVFVLYAN